MKLGKIFIFSSFSFDVDWMYGEIYQNTSYRFDEYNRTIVLDGGHVETEDGYDLILHFVEEQP